MTTWFHKIFVIFRFTICVRRCESRVHKVITVNVGGKFIIFGFWSLVVLVVQVLAFTWWFSAHTHKLIIYILRWHSPHFVIVEWMVRAERECISCVVAIRLPFHPNGNGVVHCTRARQAAVAKRHSTKKNYRFSLDSLYSLPLSLSRNQPGGRDW